MLEVIVDREISPLPDYRFRSGVRSTDIKLCLILVVPRSISGVLLGLLDIIKVGGVATWIKLELSRNSRICRFFSVGLQNPTLLPLFTFK